MCFRIVFFEIFGIITWRMVRLRIYDKRVVMQKTILIELLLDEAFPNAIGNADELRVLCIGKMGFVLLLFNGVTTDISNGFRGNRAD